MPYVLQIAEADTLGAGKFVNAKGNTECVVFIQQAAGAPVTTSWRQGRKISDIPVGGLLRGTAIATFDANGRYPTDGNGMHAAIYLSHDANKIVVLDQWRRQGEVRQRQIRFNRPKGTSRSDNADTFYVIE